MVEEEPEEDVTEAGEDSTEVPVLADEEVDQRTPTNQQDVVVTQTGTGLTSFVAVPQHHFVARAPLTPATSRFVPAALPNVVTHAGHVAVPEAGHLVHAAAAPAVVRAAVATPVAAPVSLAAVSSGYFTFPGAGIAFQF